MFLPPVHAEPESSVLFQFIRENPLGMLITGIKSSQEFLQCTHAPFVLDLPEETTGSPPQGRLRAHIAKQNPQVKGMIEELVTKSNIVELEDNVLVVFNDTGKVVPTWNYSAVQVYGKLCLYYDSKTPEAGAFLAKQIDDLSQHTEKSVMGHTGGENPQPWKVSDAPRKYIELMQRNIVGIEVRIEKVQGKFKMSQEMKPGDREGVVVGFARMGGENAEGISNLVKERGALHDARAQK
ncbi:unnamed protein product [Penicillium palitans]